MQKNTPINRVQEILVVHHTHTDWGYTTHQSLIEEVHLGFIDEAVRLCRMNPDREEALRYRWTCESSWVVRAYLRKRSRKQCQDLLECIHSGDIEVAALPLQPTPLADDRTIRAALTLLDDLRSEGISSTVALTCDINGLSWPWADALLDAGVTSLCTAMNFVCGGGMPRWTYFQWKAPSGRLLPCWQGTHYNQGAYWGLNHNAYTIAEVAGQRVRELEPLPYEKILLQVTNIPPDNMGPHPEYLQGLAEYNQLASAHGWPRMRTSTLKEWTSWLENSGAEGEVYEGDWTDWWAAGVASTPRETAVLMDAQRRISLAETRGMDPEVAREVRKKIFVAAEHTWGASSSIKAPWLLASQAGIVAKQNLMYEAAYAANEALRLSLADEAVMHDPNFTSFDPAWRALTGEEAVEGDRAFFEVANQETETVSWKRFLGEQTIQVLVEELEGGDRNAWYEKGSFRQPETAGQWPDGSGVRRKPLEEARVECREAGSEYHVEVSFTLDYTMDPRSVYVVFPFLKKAKAVCADVGGVWADPRHPQIPGSCVNWWTLHQGVLMDFGDSALLWTPWDTPMTMFDAPCSVPPKQRNILSQPTLVSWALNTYWFTNFYGMSGGEYRFRYRIKHWSRVPRLDEVNEYSSQYPLPSYPSVLRRSDTLPIYSS